MSAKIIQAPHLVAKRERDNAVAAFVEKATAAKDDGAPAEAPPPAPPPPGEAPAEPGPIDPPSEAPPVQVKAPTTREAADDIQAILEQNRQLVQTVLAQKNRPEPPPAPLAVDTTALEIAEAVKKGDYATLEKHGLNLQAWADKTLADISADPRDRELAQLKSELSEFRAWREQQERKAQEQQAAQVQARRQAVENEVKDEITKSLQKDPKLSIVLSLAGGIDEVYSTIARYAEESARVYGTPQWLPPREAANAVLNARKGELEALLTQAQSHPDFQSLFAAQQAAQSQAAVAQKPQAAPVTLSGSQFSGAAPVVGETLEDRETKAVSRIQAYLNALQAQR